MRIKKINISKVKDEKMENSGNCVKIAKSLINEEDFHKEHLIVMYLNNGNMIKSAEVVHIGNINTCIVSPANVFKSAIINNCNSIIVLHNHPSGILKPSAEDRDIYKTLKECGKILDIRVLDSIIFNKKGENYSLLTEDY